MSRFSQGSLLAGESGTLYYSAVHGDLPGSDPLLAVVAYFPVPSSRSKSYSTALRTDYGTLVKASGWYHDKSETLSRVAECIYFDPFTEIVLLHPQHVFLIDDPFSFLATWCKKSEQRRQDLSCLRDQLNLRTDEIGISGSSMLFKDCRDRHEVDLLISCPTSAAPIWNKILQLRATGLFVADPIYAQRFVLKGTTFDPQFLGGSGINLRHLSTHACLYKTADIAWSQKQIQIVDDREAVFYPASYGALCDGAEIKIISYRWGHRGLFQNGNLIQIIDPRSVRIIGDNEIVLSRRTAVAIIG